MSIIGKTANISGDRSRLEKLLSHHEVDITPRTEWGDRSVIFSRPENKHEPPVRGLDTHSQSCDTVGGVQGYREDTEQYVRRKPSMGL